MTSSKSPRHPRHARGTRFIAPPAVAAVQAHRDLRGETTSHRRRESLLCEAGIGLVDHVAYDVAIGAPLNIADQIEGADFDQKA